MADPATQSPYISSSSSSAAGHPEPGVPHPPPGARDCKGAGSPSCAAGAAPPCGALPEAPAAKGSPGTASPGGSGPENGQPAARAAFTLPPAGDADADAAAKEKESPESPFELILDRAAFDREYKESLLDAGTGAAGWAARGELLAKIPEDGVCDFRAPPRAAGTAGTAGISRQASGTAAALEEVSKCVREMHSFTSELLHWDLAEQAERSGGSADEPGTAAVHVPSALAASERPPPPPAAAPKADAGWPAPADDADSSGESDDTVIEDAPVPPREAREPPAAGPGSGNGGGSDVDPVAQEKPAGTSPLPKGPAEERERPDGGSGGGGESFVAFMRECLNPGGRERPGNPAPAPRRGDGSAEPAPGSPAAAGHLEQEQQTIRALRELGEEPRGRSPAPVPAPPCVPRPPEPAPGSGRRDGTAASPAERALAELLAALSARDLVSWRDVRKTGLVFGTTLLLLLSLAAFSVISVVSYLVLALLSVTISFRVYKSVVQAVQKSEEGHPFKAYLDLDIALSSEAFHKYVNAAMVHVNRALRLIIRLFLVEDLVDSLKLAVVMWLMTYVGAVFNGITLLILGELLVFTLPLVYEKYKTQIDRYVGIARDQSKALVEKIQAKLPGLAKKKPE